MEKQKPNEAADRDERHPADADVNAAGSRVAERHQEPGADAQVDLVAVVPQDDGSPPGRDSRSDIVEVQRSQPVGETPGPLEEHPVGYGGAAVAVGILVARRFGATIGIAPEMASGTVRASPDSITSVVRTAVGLVRHRLPEEGWLLGGALYSRRDGSDPLSHDKRSALYEMIQRSPGANPSLLAEELGIPLSTVRYHLRVLKREGLVKDRMITGKRRFVALGTEASEHVAVLNDAATARVMHVLAQYGPSSVSTLAEHLDRDPSTVTHHLKRLESVSLVDRRRDGRSVMNKLTRTARSHLRSGRAGTVRAGSAESSD